jgi:hypothetical protein
MFFAKLKTALRANESVGKDVKYSDSFADNLALDLKRCSIEATLGALSKIEGRYLSTILQSSYFPIESIVFTPLDNHTALDTDNFFKIHSEIDPLFEQSFYRSILLKEYRTEHGGMAMPSEHTTVTVQPSEESVDSLTDEEAYQITLRGSKKRFHAQVVLGNPKRIREEQLSTGSSKAKAEPAFDQPFVSLPVLGSSNISVELTISDGTGTTKKVVTLPAIVGREGNGQFEEVDNKILVDGKYVSRSQLVIFGVGSKAFMFIPQMSKLLAVLNGKEILGKMEVVELSHTDMTVTFGQPENETHIVVLVNDAAQYPTITLRVGVAVAPTNATPIPYVT